MAVTVPHILLTAHGSLPGGESWTCGLRTLREPTFLSAGSGAALAAAVANNWRVFYNSNPKLFGQGSADHAKVIGCTVRELNNEGITVAQYEGTPSTAALSVSQPPSMPNQIALAVSLLTTRAGRTGKGRIYLPSIAWTMSDILNSQLVSGSLTALTNSVKTLLDGVNASIATHFGSPLRLAVQSPTAAGQLLVPDGTGPYDGAEIIGIKIGSVFDTLRGRRASINEEYTGATLAP